MCLSVVFAISGAFLELVGLALTINIFRGRSAEAGRARASLLIEVERRRPAEGETADQGVRRLDETLRSMQKDLDALGNWVRNRAPGERELDPPFAVGSLFLGILLSAAANIV